MQVDLLSLPHLYTSVILQQQLEQEMGLAVKPRIVSDGKLELPRVRQVGFGWCQFLQVRLPRP